jgi:hypothetical protein
MENGMGRETASMRLFLGEWCLSDGPRSADESMWRFIDSNLCKKWLFFAVLLSKVDSQIRTYRKYAYGFRLTFS